MLWQPCVASTTGMKFYTRSNRSTNSSPPNAAYMYHWTRPSLVQVMACRQFRSQASTWTNDSLLSIGLLGTNFSEIWIGILSFSFKKMHLKMSSAKKWRPFWWINASHVFCETLYCRHSDVWWLQTNSNCREKQSALGYVAIDAV